MSIATDRRASVSVEIGGQEIVFETGKLAKQADGAVVVRSGDTMVLATAVGRTEARADADFFPLDGRRRGADVRRRQDPGRLLQARGPRQRARHPDRAHDRPPDPAALAEGLQERGAGDLHRAVRRHGDAARHPRDQRRLGGPDGLAAAVPRPDRRGPRRPDRRRAGAQPVAAAARGLVARPDRRRHEGRPDDGRGRRRRGARGDASSRRSTSRTPRSGGSARRSRTCARRSASRSGSIRS